jgi:hypothetical protein
MTGQSLFGFCRAPWSIGHAAEADSHVANPLPVQVERDRCRCNCKFVRRPIAYFQIQGAAAPGACGDEEGSDDLSGPQARLDMRMPIGRYMKRCNGNSTRPSGSRQLHLRFEGDQRHREIAGILRNAVVIDAEYRMVAIETRDGRATRARAALVACVQAGIAIISAPRFL